ncbi:MAG: glycosyltransferase, partial [Thermoplasmata archaeon]
GTSASLLEAMACGLFPVVSDIPANRAWIEDGKNGFLVPLDNQEILARRIVEALQDGDLADAAMKRNIELIKRRALWRDNMKLIETVYRQLCEGG